MPLDIGGAIQDGIERTLARNGLYFVAITFVLDAVGALFSTSVTRRTVMRAQVGPAMQPRAPSLGLSPAVAGLLSLLVTIVSLVVVIAMLRTFVSEETETIPQEHFTRNLVLALVNTIIGGIVFSIAVAIGFVLLVIPGIFLLVSLFFWNIYVVVEDENFIEAYRSSWSLTSGHRLRLFALGLIVVIIAIVIGAIFGVPRAFLPDVVGFLIAQVGSAFSGVFVLATAARTYEQLTSEEAAGATPDADAGAEPEPTTRGGSTTGDEAGPGDPDEGDEEEDGFEFEGDRG